MVDTSPRVDIPPDDKEFLQFMEEEGLEMLAAFRKIEDRANRDLLVDLARAIAAVSKSS